MRYGYTPLVCGAILLVFLVADYRRNEVWRDPVVLWKDVTAKSPEKPRAWLGLGSVYMQKFARTSNPLDSQQAMAALMRADVIAQRQHDLQISVPAETDMAILMMHGGDAESAALILQRVVKFNPGYGEAWAALAMLHARLGDPAEAISISRQLLIEDPGWSTRASLYLTRAQAYCRLGEDAKAEQSYARARMLDHSLPAGHCE